MDRIIFRNRNLSKSVLAVIVVVIVVIAGASLVYYNSKKPQTSTSTTTSTQSISTTTSTSTFTTTSTTTLQSLQPLIPESYSALAGQPLEVSIPNFKPGYYALVYDGSGKIINVTNQYFNLTFNYPGSYLVYYNIYSQGNLIGSSSNNLIEIVVTPYISFNESNYITVPVIAINKGPVIAINQPFNLSLGFLQPPSGNNITIKEYIISFSNGTKITLPARNSTGYAEQVFLTGSGNISYIEPVKNPITVSFNTPGLYPISLTIVTENISSGKTYNYTVYHTVAVSSENMQFNLYSIQSSIPNPGVIVDAEVVPGGPFTFDPSLFPDTVSNEIINNIYGSLVWYYQSSTTQFIPMLAEYIPTVGNWSNVTNRYKYGAISPNYTIYIF